MRIWTWMVMLAAAGPAPDSSDVVSPVAWTRDSERIAYVEAARQNGQVRWSLWTASVERSGTRRLLASGREPLSAPACSPDGRRLAFQKLVSAQDRWALQTHVISAEDGKPLARFTTNRLARRPEAASVLPLEGPRWSRDGSMLAVVWLRDKQVGYALLNLGTGKVRRLLADCHGPSWSPDGKQVAFFRPQGSGWSLAVADVGSRGVPKVLGALAGRLMVRPVWVGRDVLAAEPWQAQGTKGGLRLRRWSVAEGNERPPIQAELDRHALACVVDEQLRTAAALTRTVGPAAESHVATFDPRNGQWLTAIDLPGTEFAQTSPLPGAVAMAPNGRMVAFRHPIGSSRSLVGLADLGAERAWLLLDEPSAQKLFVASILGRCRRLLGFPPDAPALATPTLRTMAAVKRKARSRLLSLARTGVRQIEACGVSTDAADAGWAAYAAQFHLILGDGRQAWRDLQRLRAVRDTLADDPQFLLFQARCFFLMNEQASAMAATRLITANGRADPELRRQALALHDMAERRLRR